MSQETTEPVNRSGRRHFLGGSDARIIMGDDEGTLLRLWREKRGELAPEDLSGNLIVQLASPPRNSIGSGMKPKPDELSRTCNSGAVIPR